MNGKGSRPRPKSIPPDEWAENYERIFKKGKENMNDNTANITDTTIAEQFDAEQFDAVLLRAHDVQIRNDVAWFSDKEGRLFETMPHAVYSKLMRKRNEARTK